VSFLADGTYIRINNPAAPGIPGFERGLYSWAGNAAGGAFALTTLFDTDGTNGSSARNGQMGLTQIVTGNALTFNDSYCTACGAFLPLTRLTWDAGSIVGGWILGNAALPNNTQYVVLLDSNAGFKFFVGGDNDGAGAEMGTYTWDPITHVFVTNPPDNGTTTVTLTRRPPSFRRFPTSRSRPTPPKIPHSRYLSQHRMFSSSARQDFQPASRSIRTPASSRVRQS
jgi:hypothetical protein